MRINPSPESPGQQRIEFIGSVAGSFDLRDFIEREDGMPLTGLAAIPVTVVSRLPPDCGTDPQTTEPSPGRRLRCFHPGVS